MSLTSFRRVSPSSLAASPQVPGPSRNCGARGLGRLCAALSCLSVEAPRLWLLYLPILSLNEKKKFFFMIFTVEKFLVFVSAGSQICAPSLLSSSLAQTSQTNWVYVQRPPPGAARTPAGGPLAVRGSRGQPRWCVPGVLSLGTVSRCSVGFSMRTPPSLG